MLNYGWLVLGGVALLSYSFMRWKKTEGVIAGTVGS